MRKQQRREQLRRIRVACELLQNATRGEINVDGELMRVRISMCGMLYGTGEKRHLRINPHDVEFVTETVGV